MATHSSILAWKNPMDRGAWQAAVHGVTKSWTGLSNWSHTHTHTVDLQCYVSFFCTAKWLSYTYIHRHTYMYFFHNLFHHGLSQDIEDSSLWRNVGPCLKVLVVQSCPTLCVSTSFIHVIYDVRSRDSLNQKQRVELESWESPFEHDGLPWLGSPASSPCAELPASGSWCVPSMQPTQEH